MTVPWIGTIAMMPGIGVFLGESGDNKPHKHWAHQIAIGIEADIEVVSATKCYRGRAFWITAGIRHQLKTARVLCIYLDPTHDICETLLPQISMYDSPIAPLDEITHSLYLSHFSQAENIQSALEAFNQQCRCTLTSADNAQLGSQDKKLEMVLMALHSGAQSGQDISRSALATMAHLSPSRFSHWFSERTGLPLRSYKKWLKLINGFELSRRMSLTEAAVIAGFTDQAHFCRAVVEAFGVNPSTIQRLLLRQTL